MPRLVLPDGKEVPLPRGEIVLGREEGCGVVLDDPGISRRHARIAWEEGRHVLYDLRSRNGTFVNGRRVDRAELGGGEEILLGQVALRFLSEAAAAGPEEILLEGAEGVPAPSGPPSRRLAPRKVAEETVRPAPPPRAKPGSLLHEDLLQYGGFYRLLILLAVGVICVGVFLGAKALFR